MKGKLLKDVYPELREGQVVVVSGGTNYYGKLPFLVVGGNPSVGVDPLSQWLVNLKTNIIACIKNEDQWQNDYVVEVYDDLHSYFRSTAPNSQTLD